MADLDPAPTADPIDPTPAASDPAPDPAPQSDPTPDPAPAADPNPADDWRARMAGDDEKLLGFLGRYQSEKAFVEAAKKDRDAVRNKTAQKLPDNPTDEELAAYRKDNGIPDKPEGYLEKLPSGLVVGDDDRPFVDQFLTKMHGVNADPAVTSAALDAYYGIVEEQEAAQAEADRDADNECVTALRDEWGADYKRNANVLRSFLETVPEDVAAALTQARGPDGKILSMNANVIRWLTAQALEVNPLATVVPGAGANQLNAVNEELESLKKEMAIRGSDYWKNPAKQERYRVLLEAQDKVKSQG